MGNGTGPVLSEIYEMPADGATSRLVNVSVLKAPGTGLTVGFVITGGTRNVLVRAVGPTLATPPFNLASVAPDPRIDLYAGEHLLGENNDWGGVPAFRDAFAAVGAFALPNDSRDAVLMATLLPGNYSAHVTSTGAATGVVLVEVYEMR
jgi:hypothetical protein